MIYIHSFDQISHDWLNDHRQFGSQIAINAIQSQLDVQNLWFDYYPKGLNFDQLFGDKKNHPRYGLSDHSLLTSSNQLGILATDAQRLLDLNLWKQILLLNQNGGGCYYDCDLQIVENSNWGLLPLNLALKLPNDLNAYNDEQIKQINQFFISLRQAMTTIDFKNYHDIMKMWFGIAVSEDQCISCLVELDQNQVEIKIFTDHQVQTIDKNAKLWSFCKQWKWDQLEKPVTKKVKTTFLR